MFGIHFLPLKINSNCHILKRYFYSSLSFFVLIIMTKCILNLMLHIYKVTYSVALLRLGVSKSINNLGGGSPMTPPQDKGLCPIFQDQFIEKEIRPITLIVWVLFRFRKN